MAVNNKFQNILMCFLVGTLISKPAFSAYFIYGDVNGYRCTDFSFFNKCKEIEVAGYVFNGNYYKFEHGMGFNQISEFNSSRKNPSEGICRQYIGYKHTGDVFSKLFKKGVDKAFSSTSVIGFDGEQVSVDYIEFRCYEQ